MVIQLPQSTEDQLRDLAQSQGRDVGHLVEEALRMYFEVAAITDLDSQDIAETQMALVGELGDIKAWEDDG